MHVIRDDDARVVLEDVLAIGRAGDGPLFRLHRTADGDAIVVAARDATRDGMPMIGGLAVVRWGTSALLRAAAHRLEIVWEERCVAVVARDGERCRLCFGALAAGAAAIRCRCEARFHHECDAVRVSCPACGDQGGPR